MVHFWKSGDEKEGKPGPRLSPQLLLATCHHRVLPRGHKARLAGVRPTSWLHTLPDISALLST